MCKSNLIGPVAWRLRRGRVRGAVDDVGGDLSLHRDAAGVAAIVWAALLLVVIAPVAHADEHLEFDFTNSTVTGALHPYCDAYGTTTPPGPPWRDDYGVTRGPADFSGLDRSSCDDWQRLCWRDIGILDDGGGPRDVALCATVVGGDYEGRYYSNGLSGLQGNYRYALLNVRTQSCVDLKFEVFWQDTLDTTPVKVPSITSFEMVVLDVDGGFPVTADPLRVDPQEQIESVRIVGTPVPSLVTRTSTTEILKASTLPSTTPTSNSPYDPPAATGPERYIGAQGAVPYSLLRRCPDPGAAGDNDPGNDYYRATTRGTGGDNPTNGPDNLTVLQSNRTVSFEFENQNEFTLSLSVTMPTRFDTGQLEALGWTTSVTADSSDNSFNVPSGNFLFFPPGALNGQVPANEVPGFRIGNRVAVTGFSVNGGQNNVTNAIITDLTPLKMTVACAPTACTLADEGPLNNITIKKLADGWKDPDWDSVTYPATTISAQASDHSFNDTAGQFLIRGFAAGQRVTVTGFSASGGQNNVTLATIASVTADKMTINATGASCAIVNCPLVDELAGAAVVIDGSVENDCTSGQIGAGCLTNNKHGDFEAGRNFLFAGRVTFRPTAVTLGEVDLRSIAVTDLLPDAGQMDASELLAVLEMLDPAAAAALADAEAAQIREVLITTLDPDGDGQVALLRWTALEQRGTVGFYVDRREADGNGSWVRINGDMLPGVVMAPMGAEYVLFDPDARGDQVYEYLLTEQEAAGSTRRYGPFTLEMRK